MSTPPAKPPEILDKIVDMVLAHKPVAAKAKAKAEKNRKKTAKQQTSETDHNKDGREYQ
jgi:hypothetical protein